MHGPVPSDDAPSTTAERTFQAAQTALDHLEQGRRLDRQTLQAAMTAAFGTTDAAGGWVWKQAYDAAETAVTLLLLRYGPAMLAQAGAPAEMLRFVSRIVALEPAQTRRDDVQRRFEQFSTPLELAWIAAAAADVQPNDILLEPSAGTGLLASVSGLKLDGAADGRMALNELTATRAGLLRLAFPETGVTRHDAELIHDMLPELRPSAVVMNPPFTRAALTLKTPGEMDLRHVAAAYRALRPDGRLVAITSRRCLPDIECVASGLRADRPGARRPLHLRNRRQALPQPRHDLRDPDHRAREARRRPRPAERTDRRRRRGGDGPAAARSPRREHPAETARDGRRRRRRAPRAARHRPPEAARAAARVPTARTRPSGRTRNRSPTRAAPRATPEPWTTGPTTRGRRRWPSSPARSGIRRASCSRPR